MLERTLELVLGNEALLDKQPPERPPANVCRFHDGDIGANGAEIKTFVFFAGRKGLPPEPRAATYAEPRL